jgi:hypothetical protein
MKTKTIRSLNMSALALAALMTLAVAAPTLPRDTSSALLGMVRVVKGNNDVSRSDLLIETSGLTARRGADSGHVRAERLISDVVVVSRDADNVRP